MQVLHERLEMHLHLKSAKRDLSTTVNVKEKFGSLSKFCDAVFDFDSCMHFSVTSSLRSFLSFSCLSRGCDELPTSFSQKPKAKQRENVNISPQLYVSPCS